MPVAPLFMVRFSTFNLVLKVESKLYYIIGAFLFCEFAKIAKFAKLNRTRNLVDLQYRENVDLHHSQTCEEWPRLSIVPESPLGNISPLYWWIPETETRQQFKFQQTL